MITPVDRTTAKQTHTKSDAREAAQARARAEAADARESKSKPEPSLVERALKTVGLGGAVNAAKEGAARVAKAGSDQPTPERAVVAKLIEAAKSHAAVTAAAAGDVIKAGTKVAAPVVAAGAAAADRVTKPVRREIAEAATEVGESGKNLVDTQKNNISETIREVRDAWNNAPTPERAVISAAYELVENNVQNHARTVGSLLGFGKEAVEGAVEITLNHPVIEAQKIAATEAAKGLWAAGGAVLGFGKDVVGRGANGATEATKAAASTQSSIIGRTIDQQKENVREIGDAASTYARDWVDSLNPFDGDVSDAWNNAATPERRPIAAALEIGENMVEDSVRNVSNAANLGKEVVEASVENTVNNFKNGVDAVTGAAGAVGSFFGGFFG